MFGNQKFGAKESFTKAFPGSRIEWHCKRGMHVLYENFLKHNSFPHDKSFPCTAPH